MKRNRHDGINLPSPSDCVRRHERAERRSKLAPASVFEALNGVGDGTAVLEHGARQSGALGGRGARAAERDRLVDRLVTSGATQRSQQADESVEDLTHDDRIGRLPQTVALALTLAQWSYGSPRRIEKPR